MTDNYSAGNKKYENIRALAANIAKILDDEKGQNIKVLEISTQTVIADFFVLATGTSSVHVRALAGEVEEKLKKTGLEPTRVSGLTSKDWIIIDYDDIIVHIFNSEARDYYKLEKLWVDVNNIDVEKFINEQNMLTEEGEKDGV